MAMSVIEFVQAVAFLHGFLIGEKAADAEDSDDERV